MAKRDLPFINSLYSVRIFVQQQMDSKIIPQVYAWDEKRWLVVYVRQRVSLTDWLVLQEKAVRLQERFRGVEVEVARCGFRIFINKKDWV